MLSPLPGAAPGRTYFAHSPRRVSLPRKGHRVGLRIVLFEACSAFTCVTACTLALSPMRDTHSEGFSYLVTSIAAPVASGWSVSPGGTCTHWKAPPSHGAHPNRTSARLGLKRAPRTGDLLHGAHPVVDVAIFGLDHDVI